MTGQSKVISFKDQKNGQSAIDQINEFFKNPRIKPINISEEGKDIYLLYKEKYSK
jgi:hypothetical protein